MVFKEGYYALCVLLSHFQYEKELLEWDFIKWSLLFTDSNLGAGSLKITEQ